MRLVTAVALLSCTSCVTPASDPPSVTSLGPHEVSSLLSDVKLAVRPDGRQQVWGVIRPGGNLDLLERHRLPDGRWSAPSELGVNTLGEDFDPAFSPDGKTLYFHSDREGGYGKTDIYAAQVVGDFDFSEARNLGPLINSAGAEWAPWPLADGRLLFASDGWGVAGRHDLFFADFKARPEPIGAPVNSDLEDFDAALSPDGSTLVFSRGTMSETVADVALYRSRRVAGRWATPEKLAIGCGNFSIGAAFLPDGGFAFASNCGSSGVGRMDIYVMPAWGVTSRP